jgi:hypothetical protein
MNSYITVKEFAKRIKLNKAAAYNLLLKEEYKDFIVIENGVKKVNIDIIQAIQGKKPPKQEPPQVKENTPKEENKDFISFLIEENKELKQTIAEKEKKIEELTKIITELTSKSHDLIEKSLTITAQQQYLTAAQQQEKPKEKGFKRLFSRRKEKEIIESEII